MTANLEAPRDQSSDVAKNRCQNLKSQRVFRVSNSNYLHCSVAYRPQPSGVTETEQRHGLVQNRLLTN